MAMAARRNRGALLTWMAVAFVVTVLVTRVYLQLTGFPSIGSGKIHLAHAVWGGLLLIVAAILPLMLAPSRVLTLCAVLGGVGAGLFMDPFLMERVEIVKALMREARMIVLDEPTAALNDQEILKACIPGCESLDKLSDTEMTAKVRLRIGPVSAAFGGKVTLSDIDPPNGYKISGEGQGGVAGFAKGGAVVRLFFASDVPPAGEYWKNSGYQRR